MSITIAPYQVTIADDEQKLSEVYKLRYQVYCQEKNFEPNDQQQAQQEKDNFDDQSIHILISDQRNKTPVATVRLIIASNPDQAFHFESLSHQTFSHVHEKPRSHYAEVSRLAISKDYRNETSQDLSNQLKQTVIPPLTLVYASLMIVTQLLEIESVCLLEPRFADYLTRSGLKLTAIGEPFDHNGIRRPYILCLNQKQRQQHPQLEQLYQALYQGLKKQVQQHHVAILANK